MQNPHPLGLNSDIFEFENILAAEDPLKRHLKWVIYAYCHNPNDNTTQPQHCSWVEHENDFAHHPTHHRHSISDDHQSNIDPPPPSRIFTGQPCHPLRMNEQR